MRTIFIICAAAALATTGCQRQSSEQGSSGPGTSSSEGSRSSQATNNPDNTGINKRDRSDEALTSGDQGESQGDREITRSIRRAIVKNDQLSGTADNVKIITSNGKVTLRGPVKSEQEKTQIGSIAQQAPGATSVDNQLEVKP